MPIDANVYNQIDTQAPLKLASLFDPAEQRKRQLLQMQEEEQFAQLSDQKTLRGLLRGAGTSDPNILAQKATEAGLYKPAQEFRTQALAADKAKREQESAALDAMKKRLDLVDPFLGMMFADPSDQGLMRTASQMVQSGVFTPEQAQQFLVGMPKDANERRKQLAMAGLKGQDRIAHVTPKTQVINDTVVDVNPNTNPNAVGAYIEPKITSAQRMQDATTRRGQDLTNARGIEANAIARDKAAKESGTPTMPKLTESQAKASTYLGQMLSAEEALKRIGGDQNNPVTQANVMAAGGIANYLASPQAQQIKQAQEQWAESFLRHKTGAAATEPEVKRNARTFFPQLGDSKEVIAQKALMRQQAIQDMKLSAGPGAGAVQVVAPPQAQPPSGPAKISSDADYNALPSGAVFIGPDGKQRRKP